MRSVGDIKQGDYKFDFFLSLAGGIKRLSFGFYGFKVFTAFNCFFSSIRSFKDEFV